MHPHIVDMGSWTALDFRLHPLFAKNTFEVPHASGYPADPHWNWQGKLGEHGLGVVATLFGTLTPAPRAAHKLAKGGIPKLLEAWPFCGERTCINPNHLTLGSHAQFTEFLYPTPPPIPKPPKWSPEMELEVVRRYQAGESKNQIFLSLNVPHHKITQLLARHGIAPNPPCKLSDAKVMEARQLYAAGTSTRQLAPQFRVSLTSMNSLVGGYTYSHLPVLKRPPKAAKLVAPKPPGKSADLTDEEVREIRFLNSVGIGYGKLGKQYGRSTQTMLAIVKRRTYKHVL